MATALDSGTEASRVAVSELERQRHAGLARPAAGGDEHAPALGRIGGREPGNGHRDRPAAGVGVIADQPGSLSS
ncbi:hypothetical protein GCM10023170_078370 [Phytohabitans houttuyneae]|uniref:Uncharacterized protein n=1 Tax=Phytohabitans houttuyneae TaxID=1076126 RepID=A0A6V8K688_9ACTN|nr:hypothetical protein Phou_019780 [Phytohabitans houttuyneae]